jgi:pyruvate formate lyase activating enzyme
MAEELAARLMKYEPVFAIVGGGVTFSGGEPLLQAEFVGAAMRLLKGKMHIILQTSGCAPTDTFMKIAALADMAFFDLKLVDPALHERYTGGSNASILTNLAALNRSGLPYRIRVPMIPGVTDTPENYAGMRAFMQTHLAPCNAMGMDFLPYNPIAGGKYEAVGRRFAPGFDAARAEDIRPEWFRDIVREVTII